MYGDSGEQDDTERGYNNQNDSGNLVQEGEEQYQPDPNQDINDMGPQKADDNSFHVDQFIEKMQNNPQFSQKENEINQKIDDFIRSKLVNLSQHFQDMCSWQTKFFFCLLLLNFFSKDLILLLCF